MSKTINQLDLSKQQKRFLKECLDINIFDIWESDRFVDFTDDTNYKITNPKDECKLIDEGNCWPKKLVKEWVERVIENGVYDIPNKMWLNSLGHYYKLYITNDK